MRSKASPFVRLQKSAEAVATGSELWGFRRAGIVPASAARGQRVAGEIRQSDQVGHPVAARRAACQASGHVQRAAGKDVAVAGPVHQFDALTGGSELD